MTRIIIVLLIAIVFPSVAFAQCGTVPALGQTVLKQLAAKFPAQIRSANDDERRVWALKAAQQMAFSVSPEWGSKKAANANPQTKDGIARFVAGVLCVWDVVNGTTRELNFGEGEAIPLQVFIPVTPTDHLGAGTTAPPPPPVGGLTRADLDAAIAPLLARIAALEQSHDDKEQVIREVDERLSKQIDAITPVDTVPLLAAFNAALSELVVIGDTDATGSGPFRHRHSVKLAITRKK